MPYIPTTITHMSANLSLGSRELYAYRYTVSGGQVTPAGVKSVTAGTGVSIAGGSDITSTGVINISAGTNVSVATAAILPSGTRTTITGTLGGATTGTPQFYQTDFATADGSPFTLVPNVPITFLTMQTATTNNYAELEFAFDPFGSTPASQCFVQQNGTIAGEKFDIEFFLTTNANSTTPPADRYNTLRLQGTGGSGVTRLLPNSTGLSAFPTASQFVSCFDASGSSVWYLNCVNRTALPSVSYVIPATSTQSVQGTLYANNVVVY
jgi:hypothetical protein